MDVEHLLLYTEYRLHYFYWWMRYRQLRLTNRFCIGRRGRLRVGKQAHVVFGRGVHFMRNFTGDFYGRVIIGENVYFQHDCHISSHREITIGKHCLFGEGVSIHDENHIPGRGDDPIAARGFVVRPVRIGNNVWVGAKATILAGVTIGDNAVVGAHAVVTHDVPPYTIVAGVPAHIVREVQT